MKRLFSRSPSSSAADTEAAFGPATRLTIRVKQPETEHTVSVGKLHRWLDGGGRGRMSSC